MNDNYLWDRSDPVDREIARLEQIMAPLRMAEACVFKERYVLVLPPAPVPRRTTFAIALTMTASVVLVLGGLVWTHRTEGPSLEVTQVAGAPRVGSQVIDVRGGQGQLGVGRWLETDAGGRASIAVADIGRVEVEPQTRIGLADAPEGSVRLRLERGTMHAVIWAPPGRFFVDTPSSTAVDLGCAYSLSVDEDGAGLLRVTSGWVGFEWRGRESFIPAGAVCATRRNLGPGTPRYEDTSDAFRTALDVIDFGTPSADQRTAALEVVLAEARAHDVVTLWHLLTRVQPAERGRVFDRLAWFVPPPADVTREGVGQARKEMLDNWWDELGLGTASWWRTWKQPWR